MNTLLTAAGILTALIGLAHSIIGEIMIFSSLRKDSRDRSLGWIPTQGGSALREFQLRILWASWHVVTVLALALAAVLIHIGGTFTMPLPALISHAATAALAASATLVLIGTKGKHPAWIALLVAAVLIVVS